MQFKCFHSYNISTIEYLLQGIESAASNIEANVQSKVRLGMMEKLGDILPAKMLEKGMRVVCSVQGPESQADFFYAHLKTLA